LKSLSFLRLEKQNEGFVNRRLERILIIIAKPLSIEYTFRDGYGRNLLVDAIGTKSISKLIKSGRLYSLKDWLEGDGQKSNLSVPAWISLLEESIETGFHSMVELLLNARAWSAEELCDPLNRSLWNMRLDLTELLLTARASVAKVDFSDVCRTMNIELMKRFLRGGVDPSRQNGFALCPRPTQSETAPRFLSSDAIGVSCPRCASGARSARGRQREKCSLGCAFKVGRSRSASPGAVGFIWCVGRSRQSDDRR
jgi:hypothetical protein